MATCQRQRVTLTDQQLKDRAAPCPKCGRIIGLVINSALKQATMSPHRTAEKVPAVAPDPPAKLNVPPIPSRQLCF